jgi:hypothetical protein
MSTIKLRNNLVNNCGFCGESAVQKDDPKDIQVSDAVPSSVRTAANWIFVIGFSIFSVAVFSLLVLGSITFPEFYAIAIKHFPTVVGLPLAAMASIFIVTVFRITLGQKLSFSVFGMEFEGASGPVVLWVLCFLAITLAINTTWNNIYDGPVGEYLTRFLEKK